MLWEAIVLILIILIIILFAVTGDVNAECEEGDDCYTCSFPCEHNKTWEDDVEDGE